MGDTDRADFAPYSFVEKDLKRGSNQSTHGSAKSIHLDVLAYFPEDHPDPDSTLSQVCPAEANSSSPDSAGLAKLFAWPNFQEMVLSLYKKHTSSSQRHLAALDSTQPPLLGHNSSTAMISTTAPKQHKRPSTPPRLQVFLETGSSLAHSTVQGLCSIKTSVKNLFLACCSAPAVVCDPEGEHCAQLAQETQSADDSSRSSSESEDTDDWGVVAEVVATTHLQNVLKAHNAELQDPFEQLCQPKVVSVSTPPATAAGPTPCQAVPATTGITDFEVCSSAAFNSFTSIAQVLPRVVEVPRAVDSTQQVSLAWQQQQQQQVLDSLASPHWQFSCGSSAIQNGRTHMEDRVLAVDLTGHPAFSFTQRASLLAVFDGHGGHQTAQYLAVNLLPLIVSQGQAALRDQPVRALQTAISRAENDVVSSWVPASGHAAGSTLCLALLLGDTLHVAHVGDSGAVLAQGSKAVSLTAEHKPSHPAEEQRIRAADPSAHVTADGYLYGELAVSRGLGSAHIKLDPTKRAFVATPEVTSLKLSPTDDFLVLATDGLWDKVKPQEAIAAARKSLAESKNPSVAAQALVERAQKYGSQDNISVVVAPLHNRGIVMPKNNSRLFSRRTSMAPAGESGVSDGGAAPVAPATPSVSEGGAAGGVALCVV